jgi:hypothetical protein
VADEHLAGGERVAVRYLALTAVDVVIASKSLCQCLSDVATGQAWRWFHGPLESLGAKPHLDSFGDISPPGFEHHVVSHVGKEFCFGVVGTGRRADLNVGNRAVVFGAENEQWPLQLPDLRHRNA